MKLRSGKLLEEESAMMNLKRGDKITMFEWDWGRKYTFKHAIVSYGPFHQIIQRQDVSKQKFRKLSKIMEHKKLPKEVQICRVLVVCKRNNRWEYECPLLKCCVKGHVSYPQYPNFKQWKEIEKWKLAETKRERVNNRVKGVMTLNRVLAIDGGIVRNICEYI